MNPEMNTASLKRVLSLLTSVVAVTHVCGVRIVEIKVPPKVKNGDSVTLGCLFDLEGESLYSLNWWLNQKQFYQFDPSEEKQQIIYENPGITVDATESNLRVVTLKNVTYATAGEFKCEILADFPSYERDSLSAEMQVIDVPKAPPIISLDNQRYGIGDTLRANCTTEGSKPYPVILWYLNGKKINYKHVRQLHPTASNPDKINEKSRKEHRVVKLENLESNGKKTENRDYQEIKSDIYHRGKKPAGSHHQEMQFDQIDHQGLINSQNVLSNPRKFDVENRWMKSDNSDKSKNREVKILDSGYHERKSDSEDNQVGKTETLDHTKKRKRALRHHHTFLPVVSHVNLVLKKSHFKKDHRAVLTCTAIYAGLFHRATKVDLTAPAAIKPSLRVSSVSASARISGSHSIIGIFLLYFCNYSKFSCT